MDNEQLPEDQNLNYYQEYCRLFIANVVLTTQMKELNTEKDSLQAQLENLNKQLTSINSKEISEDDAKKRFRRSAKFIEKKCQCPLENCKKWYGSEGSMNQHIKLKHVKYYNDKIKSNDDKEQIIQENEKEVSSSELEQPSQGESKQCK